MKKLSLLLFVSSLFLAGFSQTKSSRIYFDKDWKLTSRDSAAYYRIINFDDGSSTSGFVTDYYLSGNKQMTGHISNMNFTSEKDGIRSGIFLYYYENGKLSQRSFYKDNKLEGASTHWDQNGILDEECNYNNGNREGKYVSYYENGKKEFVGNYVNNKLNGEYISWYSNDGIKEKGSYLNDKLDGNIISYDSLGSKLGEYVYEVGKLNGAFKKWESGGTIEGYYVDGKLDGKIKTTLKDGSYSLLNYKNGIPDGIQGSYNKSGQKIKEIKYLNGKLNGYEINYEFGKVINARKIKDGAWESILKVECDRYICKNSFGDLFDDPKLDYGWPKEKFDLGNYGVEYGKGYVINVQDSLTAIKAVIPIPINMNEDYHVASSIVSKKVISKSFVGLIWGLKDKNNYNYFNIHPSGLYSIGTIINGKSIVIKPWTKSDFIKKGVDGKNILSITKKGGSVIFELNLMETFIANADEFVSGNNFGLGSYGKVDIIAEDFFVSQPLKGIIPSDIKNN